MSTLPPLPPESTAQRAAQMQVDHKLLQEISNRAEEIKSFDAITSEQLVSIANCLSSGTYDHLVTVDLYHAVNPVAVEERAFLHYRKGSRLVGLLEVLRNFLVLVPIFLTWAALAIAASNYAATIDMYPYLREKPFLLLWEQGFPAGWLTGLRFSHIAWVDFWLLFVVIFLTIGYHLYSEVHTDDARRDAIRLRQRLEQSLGHLGEFFSRIRVFQTPHQIAAHLARTAQNLERMEFALEQQANQVQARVQSLDELQQRFFVQQSQVRDQLIGLSKQQEDLTLRMATSVEQLNTATKTIEANLHQVSGDLGQAVVAAQEAAGAASSGLGAARDAVSAASGAATAVEKAATAVTAVEQQMRAVVVGFEQQTHSLVTGFEQQMRPVAGQLGAVAAGFEQQVRPVVGQLGAVADSLNKTNQTLAGNVDEAAKLNLQLQVVTGETGKVTANIGVISGDLRNIGSSLQVSAQQTADTAKATAGLLQPLGALVGQLPTVSQGMQTVVTGLNRTSQEMAQHVVESGRLNQLLQQTVQTFPQGVQQMGQVFSQSIVQPLTTQVNAIQAQLTYVHQQLRSMPGISAHPVDPLSRFFNWLIVLMLAAILIPLAILAPLFVLQGSGIALLILAPLMLVLIAALAWALARLGG